MPRRKPWKNVGSDFSSCSSEHSSDHSKLSALFNLPYSTPKLGWQCSPLACFLVLHHVFWSLLWQVSDIQERFFWGLTGKSFKCWVEHTGQRIFHEHLVIFLHIFFNLNVQSPSTFALHECKCGRSVEGVCFSDSESELISMSSTHQKLDSKYHIHLIR